MQGWLEWAAQEGVCGGHRELQRGMGIYLCDGFCCPKSQLHIWEAGLVGGSRGHRPWGCG